MSAMSLWDMALAPARSRTFSHSSHVRPVALRTASLPTPASRRGATRFRAGALALRAGALRMPVGLRTPIFFTGLLRGALRAAALRVTVAMRLPPSPLQEDQLFEKVHVLL